MSWDFFLFRTFEFRTFDIVSYFVFRASNLWAYSIFWVSCFSVSPLQSLRFLGHHVILDFHQPMHRNLILDTGVKDAQTEEETAEEEEDAGDKDQHHIFRKE